MIVWPTTPSPYLAETDKLIAAFGPSARPSHALQKKYNQWIVDLKAAGVWAKLDILKVRRAATVTAANLNWVNPGTYTTVHGGTTTFVANSYVTANGTTGYLDEGVLANALPNMLLNSAHVGFYQLNDVADNNGYGVGTATTSTLRVRARTGAGNFQASINDATQCSIVVANSVGHHVANRSGASAREFYKAGASIGSDAQASTALATTQLYCLRSGSAFATGQQVVFHAGGSLTAGEVSSLSTVIDDIIATIV
jgi:hypothetical protein